MLACVLNGSCDGEIKGVVLWITWVQIWQNHLSARNPKQWCSTRTTLSPMAHLAMSKDILGCPPFRVGFLLEARDTAKHHTVLWTAFLASSPPPRLLWKNHLVWNVNSAEVEEPQPRTSNIVSLTKDNNSASLANTKKGLRKVPHLQSTSETLTLVILGTAICREIHCLSGISLGARCTVEVEG